jgi:hypothetical protein
MCAPAVTAQMITRSVQCPTMQRGNPDRDRGHARPCALHSAPARVCITLLAARELGDATWTSEDAQALLSRAGLAAIVFHSIHCS